MFIKTFALPVSKMRVNKKTTRKPEKKLKNRKVFTRLTKAVFCFE